MVLRVVECSSAKCGREIEGMCMCAYCRIESTESQIVDSLRGAELILPQVGRMRLMKMSQVDDGSSSCGINNDYPA